MRYAILIHDVIVSPSSSSTPLLTIVSPSSCLMDLFGTDPFSFCPAYHLLFFSFSSKMIILGSRQHICSPHQHQDPCAKQAQVQGVQTHPYTVTAPTSLLPLKPPPKTCKCVCVCVCLCTRARARARARMRPLNRRSASLPRKIQKAFCDLFQSAPICPR